MIPAGRPVADHTYGVEPPVATICAVYGWFTVAFVNVVVVIVNCGTTIVSERFLLVCWAGVLESATSISTMVVPPFSGLPLMTPVLGFSARLRGRFGDDQVSAPVPPVAVSVNAYGVPVAPLGSAAVVMVNPLVMVRVNVLFTDWCAGPAASATVTTTEPLLAAVGVPEITPEVELMVRPPGSPVADHAYGVVPPVAATVAVSTGWPALAAGRRC